MASTLWVFQSNTRAIRFYERHGFVEVERTDGAGNEERSPTSAWPGRPDRRSSAGDGWVELRELGGVWRLDPRGPLVQLVAADDVGTRRQGRRPGSPPGATARRAVHRGSAARPRRRRPGPVPLRSRSARDQKPASSTAMPPPSTTCWATSHWRVSTLPWVVRSSRSTPSASSQSSGDRRTAPSSSTNRRRDGGLPGPRQPAQQDRGDPIVHRRILAPGARAGRQTPPMSTRSSPIRDSPRSTTWSTTTDQTSSTSRLVDELGARSLLDLGCRHRARSPPCSLGAASTSPASIPRSPRSTSPGASRRRPSPLDRGRRLPVPPIAVDLVPRSPGTSPSSSYHESWAATLAGCRRALAGGGTLVFGGPGPRLRSVARLEPCRLVASCPAAGRGLHRGDRVDTTAVDPPYVSPPLDLPVRPRRSPSHIRSTFRSHSDAEVRRRWPMPASWSRTSGMRPTGPSTRRHLPRPSGLTRPPADSSQSPPPTIAIASGTTPRQSPPRSTTIASATNPSRQPTANDCHCLRNDPERAIGRPGMRC